MEIYSVFMVLPIGLMGTKFRKEARGDIYGKSYMFTNHMVESSTVSYNLPLRSRTKIRPFRGVPEDGY
jgi:hypothetical protein